MLRGSRALVWIGRNSSTAAAPRPGCVDKIETCCEHLSITSSRSSEWLEAWTLVKPTETTLESPWWHEKSFWYGLHTLLDPVRVPFFQAVLRNHSREFMRVLDLGSGAGFVSVGLGDTAHMTAVDLSSNAVFQARAAGVPRVAVADATRLPFGDATYDAVICSEVLEHITEKDLAIAEAARITVPGGLFLFSTPTRTAWSRLALIEAAQRWRLTRVLPPDLHVWDHFLTREELVKVLDIHGFRICHITGVGLSPNGWPRMLAALALLKTGRIGYAEAGRRIDLTVTKSMKLAMIGYAERVE